jgi:Fe-S cluster assembly iron-binding protein IscA
MEMSSLAAELITQHVRSRNTPGAGFRIRRDGDHRVADGLKVGYARRPQPGDAVISRGGAQVFVEEAAEPLVESLTLDAKRHGNQYRLVLH